MRLLRPLASLLALLQTAFADNALPYNPTRLFVWPESSEVYLFQPSNQSIGQSQLRRLDYSFPFPTPKNDFGTLYDTLPFLHEDELTPYTPTIDSAGNITVIAGNCSEGANGSQVWRFVADEAGNGTWSQYQLTESGLGSDSALAGPNFLASAVAFSEHVEATSANTDIYVFGGMCPLSNSTAATWTSAAEYSNLMLSLSPDASNVGYTDYDLSLTTARGPPIAEAGFSITPLSPSYSSNTETQNETQTQNFVLLGGHTKDAFINMSQVALFSLPQEGWTFLPVAQPSSANTQVEPRSGHTAVLSPDGSSVTVFGGWVGDVDTPAQPQLAVLSLGSEYGGSGVWSWSIPAPSGSGPASGAGLYGHAAAMLPGGVMMVVGGYSIPASSSKRIKRDVQTTNTQTYLYNVTSNAWIDTYTPQSTTNSSGPLSRKSQQAGLGAGLGIGAAILISLSVVYFWYTRRLKRAQQHRERMLLSRSSDGSLGQLDQSCFKRGSIDGRGGDAAAVGRFWNVWDHDTGAYPQRPDRPDMQEQAAGVAGSTGLFVNMPSPTRGLRKGTNAKNYQYHPAPRYDDKRISRGSTNIHTITERDEEDGQEGTVIGSEPDDLTDAERKLREVERVLSSLNDPFTDIRPNPLGSHPVSPELGYSDTVRRVPTSPNRLSVPLARQSTTERIESPNWRAESEPTMIDNTGRVSPTKSSSDERTSSTLSEQSQRSNVSSNSMARTASTRTSNLLAAAAATRFANNNPHADNSPTDERTHTMSTDGGRKSPCYYNGRPRASTNGSMQMAVPTSATSTDGDSFMTAKSSFVHLQNEGEALLGGRPTMDRDDPYQRAMAAHSTTADNTGPIFGSYDRSTLPSLPPRRRQGWMGSLRRAINAVAAGDRSFSFNSMSGEQFAEQERAASNSPTKDRRRVVIGSTPRRAISDGGALLRQKRGQKDWQEPRNPFEPYHDDPDAAGGDWGEPLPERSSLDEKLVLNTGPEDDWDVEGAASKRDVQVMFTVPKTRLRVVNASDMDRMSVRSASESMLSRSGSVRDPMLRREESVRTLRARSEGADQQQAALPATVAEEERYEDAVAVAGEQEDWPFQKEKAS